MRRLLFIIPILLLTACNSGVIYKEYKDLSPNIVWKKSKKIEFEVPVEDTTTTYDMILTLRHITGFPWKEMRINMQMTTPSGIVSHKKYQIQVMDEDKNYVGSGSGDYWDIEQLMEKKIKFHEQGIYTFTATHDMPVEPVPFVMELGLIIKRTPAQK